MGESIAVSIQVREGALCVGPLQRAAYVMERLIYAISIYMAEPHMFTVFCSGVDDLVPASGARRAGGEPMHCVSVMVDFVVSRPVHRLT